MDTKIINSWIKFVEPQINKATKVVVLGYGEGHHILEFNKRFPFIDITVVDPRVEKIQNPLLRKNASFHYVSTMDGVYILKGMLVESELPCPIVAFRPCWYPYKQFFNWAEYTLKGNEDFWEWKDSSSEFILESLFR